LFCVFGMYGQNVFIFVTACLEGFVMVEGSCVGKYVIMCYVYDIVFVTSNFTGKHLWNKTCYFLELVQVLLVATLMVILVVTSHFVCEILIFVVVFL